MAGSASGPLRALLRGQAGVSPSDSLGDHEVHDRLVNQASDRCHGYQVAYADPLQAMNVALARSILDHHVLICPDPSLDPALAVVWYGNHRAVTWNPAVAGSDGVLNDVIRSIAHADDSPTASTLMTPRARS